MASVVITIRIMPESPDEDILPIEKAAKKQIQGFTGNSEFKTAVQPIAFGLKALDITFVMDESKGSTEKLEVGIKGIKGVNSAEVTDVRRAVG